jgi:hypothetical protein
MADYLSFLELQAEVQAALKTFNTADTAKIALIKTVINQVYLNELPFVDSFNPLFWLLDFDDSLATRVSATITGISKASPGVVTSVHTFVAGDLVSIFNAGGMIEVNNRNFKVGTVVAGTSFQLLDLDGTNIATTNYTTYTSGGSAVHRGLTLATSGKSVQTLSNVSLAGLTDDTVYDPMDMIGHEELEAKASLLQTSSTSRPTRFSHRKSYTAAGAETNQLLWYPGADAAYRVKYWFERRLARLSGDTDVPILPPQFIESIIAGTITRLAESQVQVENQVVWPGIYKMHQEAIVEFNRKWWERNQSKKFEKPYLL